MSYPTTWLVLHRNSDEEISCSAHATRESARAKAKAIRDRYDPEDWGNDPEDGDFWTAGHGEFLEVRQLTVEP